MSRVMFRIDTSLLRECVEAVLAVVDEARLKIGEEGWKVRAVDPANVALVDLELRREAFHEYESNETVVGISFDKLRDVLRFASGEVSISINEKLTLQSSAYAYTLFISTDHPLKIEFEVGDGSGKVTYLLAPRIEAE